jgi:hypothetical protein
MASERFVASVQLALLVVLALSVLAPSAAAQQPDIRPYESEEDLWEALDQGEISFDDFLDLLELVRGGTDTLTNPPSDWEALPGSDAGYLAADSSQPITQPRPAAVTERVDLPLLTSWRCGINADLNEPAGCDGYTVVRWQSGAFRGLFDWEYDRDEGGRWRRRTLIWQTRRVTMQLGNLEPRWGRGLVVGRRSRIVRSVDRSGSFWQPTLGRHDGIAASIALAPSVRGDGFLSFLESDSLTEWSGGTQLRWSRKSMDVGLNWASSVNGIEEPEAEGFVLSSAHVENVYGAHARLWHGPRQLLAEFAINNRGVSAKAVELLWPLQRGRFHARLWSYGDGFTNPLGGGPGNSDTRVVGLESRNRAFSSRTAGERGFDFSTRLDVAPTVRLRWDWMTHREAPGEKLEHDGVFRAEVQRDNLRLTPFIRARIDEDESETYSLGNYLWWGTERRRLNLRAEYGRHYSHEAPFVRAGAGLEWRIRRLVRLAPAIRWTDPDLDQPGDGYWCFYFTETVIPAAGLKFEAALVWKKYEAPNANDPVELRLRLALR